MFSRLDKLPLTNKTLKQEKELTQTILNKKITTFDLSLLGFVDVLLIVCNNSFRDGLTNSVNLSNVSSTSNSHSDVKILESLETEEENGFEHLDSQGLGLQQLDG